MTVITITQPNQATDSREFFFKHTAISWLLLSGFIPNENQDLYTNPYTGAVATMEFV